MTHYGNGIPSQQQQQQQQHNNNNNNNMMMDYNSDDDPHDDGGLDYLLASNTSFDDSSSHHPNTNTIPNGTSSSSSSSSQHKASHPDHHLNYSSSTSTNKSISDDSTTTNTTTTTTTTTEQQQLQQQQQEEGSGDVAKDAEALRVSMELEFVQCLSNPRYLHFLAQQRYFQDQAFINYLKYLLYWKKPEYSKFIVYPHCLFFLDRLQEEGFRKELINAAFVELLWRQQFNHWRYYKLHRTVAADQQDATNTNTTSSMMIDSTHTPQTL